MSEPTPSLPPQIPTRSLKPVVFGLAGVAVAVAIGVGWKLSQSSGETPAPKPEASAPAPAPPPARDVAPAPEPPPPPPPEEEPPPPAAHTARGPAGEKTGPIARADSAPKQVPVKRDPNCDDPCGGRETPELLSALGAKAGQARSCYERALSNNSALSGKIEINVRVSPTGAACSATSTKNTLGDAVVTSCVLQRFKSGIYPKPTGGCVNVGVPINFTPQVSH